MGTSRGVLHKHDSYLLAAFDDAGNYGLGECAPLPGLSIDDRPDLEQHLGYVSQQLKHGALLSDLDLKEWPAVRFGLESSLLDLEHGGRRMFYPSAFARGQDSIATNGLIVMADVEDMRQQVSAKVAAGFSCIKLKVGALDFESECRLLFEIRREYPFPEIELRLDANGAFSASSALEKLNALSRFQVHSIEQPVRPGNREALHEICRMSPIPIALDEELIGVSGLSEKRALLEDVLPQFVILKPTLLGGLQAASEWVELARTLGIGYWVTSALESNVGLNVLCQWAAVLSGTLTQGLGTGLLYKHNWPGPVKLEGGRLFFEAGFAEPPKTSLQDFLRSWR